MVAVVVCPALRAQLESAGLSSSISESAVVSTAPHRAVASAGASLLGREVHLRHSDAVASHTPPIPRCPKLDARVRALRARLEDAAYARIVSDVARVDSRDSAAVAVRQLRETAPQMSLAFNVMVTMATCFAAGYFVAKAATGSQAVALAVGLLALIGAMAVEATLVITRLYAIDKEADKRKRREERGVERRGVKAVGAVKVPVETAGGAKRKEE